MKKKVATIVTIAMLALTPGTASADIDVISNIFDALNTVMEKVDTVTKQYTTIQANLQGLSLNRNIISQLRDRVESELKSRAAQFYNNVKNQAMSQGMMFLKSSLSSISLPGIGQYVDMGAFVNPKLSSAVGNTYLKKQHQKDDVKYMMETDRRNNNLMVENEAVLFANSFVRRVQIIEEDPCHCVDDKNNLIPDMPKCTQTEATACKNQKEELNNMKDVATVKQKYFETVMKAHNRWLRILEAKSTYYKIKDEGELNKGNVDDVTAITGEQKESNENSSSDYDLAKAMLNKNREANTLALANFTQNAINNYKNKNFTGLFSDVSQGVAGVYSNSVGSRAGVSDIMQGIATGAKAMDAAYHSDSIGDAVSSSLGGVGSIVSGTGANNNTAGVWINTIGNLADVGIDAAQSGGNFGQVLDNTIGNSQAQNALGNLQGAYGDDAARAAALAAAIQKRDEERRKAAEKTAEEINREAEEARKEAQRKEREQQARKLCDECVAKYGNDSETCKYLCTI